jgi:crotonobetainyl-CoA:carnitine CoA-transferase CaiB-like acyl-CoA transferase
MQLLSAVRVVEVGEMVAAPYAAKLLADLGASVIKVEPPTGDRARRYGPFPPGAPDDPEQSGLFLGLNTNKQNIVLDLDSEHGRHALRGLIGDADIVIHSLDAERADQVGLGGPALLQAFPSLVVCAVTPYGLSGPHAQWRGEEINVVHGGGWGYLIPGDDPDPNAPPLTVFGHAANCQAGMAAAFAALGAYSKARATGVGEIIDQSTMAHVASMLEASFIAWSYTGRIAGRSGGRILNPWGIYECSDGLIFLVTVEQDQWERLVEMMGNPEWALMPVFATFQDRAANHDLMDIYIEEWTRQHSVEDLFHQGQSQRICFAPVFTMADLARQDHLHQRGFFTDADHPVAGNVMHMAAPYRMTPESWQLDAAAPVLDATTTPSFPQRSTQPVTFDESALRERPLAGVRVIDFSWVWAGPFCTMHLAYLGAEVIKIESAQRPGLGRRLPVHPPGLEPTLNTCGYFNQWDQGKKSVELDLSSPDSIATVLELVAGADVVVDNYATGVMERLGLGDDVLRAANPDVIIASVTGFGHTGPLAKYMGYGPTTAPLSGLTSMTGHVGGGPEEAGLSFGDPAAGLTAAFAIMASLVGHSAGAPATRIDVSLWEATAANAVDLWMGHALGAAPAERMGNRNPAAAPHGIFRCAGDDAWISIACTSDDQWARFGPLIGADSLVEKFVTLSDRKTNEDELEAAISTFTINQDVWQLTEQLQAIGVAAYPSLSCPELEVNPQLVARNFWERFDHPEVGTRTHSGVPWLNHNAPNGVIRRAPLLGEHTAEILDQL